MDLGNRFIVVLLMMDAFVAAGWQQRGVHSAPSITARRRGRGPAQPRMSEGGVLILDHLNLNHEAGRHDLLRAFYFELLGCAVDPRKEENLQAGRKTVWANAGIHQFHLSEGTRAQVVDGVISLAYPQLHSLRTRLHAPPPVLRGTAFGWSEADGELLVTDPWGNRFRIFADGAAADARGEQPGGASEALALTDLTLHVGRDCPLDGIARFYERVLGCVTELGADSIAVRTGPAQTLTFRRCEDAKPLDERGETTDGQPLNNGVHVSMYVTDLPSAFRAAEALGCVYVNHRFKRRAYSLEEAVEQCMFRVLDVIDPAAPENGPILSLEHEIRSCIKADGSKYKSCPLYEVPQAAAIR